MPGHNTKYRFMTVQMLATALCLSFLVGRVAIGAEENGPTSNTGSGAPPAAKSSSAQPITSEVVLPNGLRVIFLEEHTFPVVTCLTFYRVGSRNEVAGCTGISHVLEHMLFGNVGNYRKGEIGSTIARLGGRFNGFTSDDFTAFYETVPSGKLEFALNVEAQRMRSARFTDADVQEEMANVQSEFENENRDPNAILTREVRAALYQRHTYRNRTIGWRSDVENITAQQLKSYYDRFYCPDNCTLVVSGDVSSQRVLPLIQKYFGGIAHSTGLTPPVKVVEPPQRGERRLSIKHNGKQDILQLAYHACAFEDADAAALVVLEKVLNTTYSGRFRTRLIDPKIATSGAACFEAKKEPGYFSLTVAVPPGGAAGQQKTVETVDAVINQLKQQPIADAELRRAKNQAEFAFQNEREGPYQEAVHLGYFDCLSNWREAQRWTDRIRAVSSNDIQRVSKKYLNTDARVVAWLTAPGAPKPSPAKPADTPSAPKANPSRQFEHTRLTGYKDDDGAIAPNASVASPAADAKSEKITEPKTVRQAIEGMSEALPTAIKELPSKIGGAPAAIKDIPAAVGAVPSVVKKIPAAIGDLPLAVKEIPSTIGSIPRAIKEIPGAIGGIPSAAATAVRELPSAIGGIPGVAADTIKELPGTLGAIPSAAATALKSMPSALGSLAVQVGNIPGAISKQLAPTRTDLDCISTKKLDNGINLVVFESHLAPMVQITGAVRAGTAFDPPGKPGLAAISASLFNQGTSRRGKSQVVAQQEDLGLTPHAMLRFSHDTNNIEFSTRCLSRDLKDQLELIAETLSTPATADGDIDRARQEVLNRIHQTDDPPEQKASRALMRSLLAAGSTYLPEEPGELTRLLPNLTAADERKFLSSSVVPSSTTIVIAGDITADRAAQIAENAFGSWNSKGAHQKPHAHPSAKHVVRTSVPTRDRSKTVIQFGQLVPVSRDDSDFGNLLVADAIINSHPLASRVSQRAAAQPVFGKALKDQGISTKFDTLPNSVAWSLTVAVEPNAVPVTVHALQDELKQLVKTGVSKEELTEVKRYLLGAIPVGSMSTLGSVARTLVDASSFDDPEDVYKDEMESVREASVDSVNRIIRQVLKLDQTTMVVVGSPQSIKSAGNRSAALGGQSPSARKSGSPDSGT